ncbi:dihydroxy-acid dehydratase [Dyadobacter sp. BE34]|uniref:Dihydroxy-acid dehydratase n=1 Tax=Dyadobacter fermentans TaxID=94254 RepID=A0ABU1QQW8_9BACT|nr:MULTISPECIES: IlvD/Edd family dehydratase [Dyadobacter]MDR6803535.1 dihydroxy-acid dehydratase [Dyadobacter fermentans]MDR7041276.1 dihydroxy-acid dehydratase [Dyadobacter sp. BE242]MDR7195679.1 dihydroxy-acid dehydratase [Dyadobacter sp. BE34]MDR7213776.1 dihydroxy-acid dehydratase [Dyadobacter sp. BE31]MDR7261086.1 dihydroxy-acid dehydratase [Dyadobacter sp. BE32]
MEENKLRSRGWFGKSGKDGFIYRAWMKNQGYPSDEFEGRPVIGICNTFSELTPCNGHFRELAESVKRGVWEAGGFPLEFPVMSLGETLIKPTAMLYRNLASMDVEESIRANPIDGVVLLCGCDKTTPSLVMGAASVNIPTIVVSGGPMLTGRYRGKTIATSDVWRFSEMHRKGELTQEELYTAEACMCRSDGHCAVMGTASTMACMVESLGLTLPENAAIPAADSRRKVLAHLSGRRIVEMVKEDLRLSQILTREAFENAIMINAAIGGSTNFVIHLLAIAGRIGVDLNLDDFNDLCKKIPLLLNLQPSGGYFMEDFYYAGGLPVVIKELSSILHQSVITANGKTMAENAASAECFNPEVIGTMEEPIKDLTGLAVVRGNLCENGAVIKPSASLKPELMQHRGKAIVFEDIDDYKARLDDPDLDVDENSILVLKNVGPKGYPGMPEVGNMSLPKKLLAQGVIDMVRISDGRMSGTGFGTVVLHVSPEAAVGGNLALVQDGDYIELDVENRKLHLEVSDEELARRRQHWKPLELGYNRGYVHLHIAHVTQAHEGADLDFLKGGSGDKVTRDSH